MRLPSVILLAASAGLLCSCETAYQPRTANGGYTVTQTAPDQFRVGFQGNARTTLDQVNDFTKLRSAETTLEHGFTYFVITDVENTTSVKSGTDYRQPVYPLAVSSGGYYPSTIPAGPASSRAYANSELENSDYVKPGVIFTIKSYQVKPPRIYSYDAAAVAQQIRKKYSMKTAAQPSPAGP